MAFAPIRHSGVTLWEGDPDCQAAHDALLARLIAMNSTFIGAAAVLDVNRKGNLGEFISLYVSSSYTGLSRAHKFANNATNPLGGMSLPGLDITYVLIHPSNPASDLVCLQEVKTTGDRSLNYGNNLVRDYGKLFGDDLDFTLASRLQVVANKFELEQNMPDLCECVLALAGEIPSQCPRIHLVPTLVHERNSAAPAPKLLAIRTAIASQGWTIANIHAWSIALSQIDDRLQRLARGQK